MPTTQIRLTGWPAVVIIVLVVGCGVFRVFHARSSLTDAELGHVKLHLLGQYSGQTVDELNVALAAGDDDRLEQIARNATDGSQIQFTSIRAKGPTKDTVVRLEVRVRGATPPDGRSVRYFRLEHSMLTGWRMKREVNAWSYYLKLF